MPAYRLGVRRISIGDVYRQMARQRDMTALEFNLHAALDDKIDHYVDQIQRDIATSGERVVVDSRLAWHFFADALKVHLITDPTVAAHRVIQRRGDGVEHDKSVDERGNALPSAAKARVRFLDRYGADKTRLRNYDVVCDSTRATAEEIVARIVGAMAAPSESTQLLVDPKRVHPTDGLLADILKLALLKREVGREETRTIIALASVEARDSISGWLRKAAHAFGIEFRVVEICDELRAEIRAAQARQVMVNLDYVADDLGVSDAPL